MGRFRLKRLLLLGLTALIVLCIVFLIRLPRAAVVTAPKSLVPAATNFVDWSTQFSRNVPVSEQAGIALAKQHREHIKQLIQTDPQRALAEAVPFSERQKLPAAVVAELEQPVSGRGFYGVRVATDFENNRVEVNREAVFGGRRYEAFVYGRREAQKTSDNISLHGIAVDNVIALDENPARALEPAEVAARLAANEKGSGKCPVSGLSIPATPEQPAVDVGGQLIFLCSGGHIHELNAQLIAQEGSTGGGIDPGGTVQPGWTHGPVKILYMRVQFPDKLGDPQPEADCYSMLESLNQFFIENSYGDAYVIPTVTPLLTLPFSESYYITIKGDIRLLSDARAVALAAGYDTNQYEWDVVRYTGGPGNFGGQAYVGGKGCWMKSSSAGVSAHEHGHNYGLWHANYWLPYTPGDIGQGTNSEYGNSFDTMGAANAGNYHFNTEFKNALGWLPSASVNTVTDSGLTNRIYTHDQANRDDARRYALKIFKDFDRDYWVELRQKFSSTPWIFNGVQLNWSPWSKSNGGTHLLDTTPGTPDGKNDAAVVVGRTFSDFGAGVHITPVAKLASTPAAMDVVVNLGSFPSNQPPTTAVAASATTVGTNIAVTLTATGTDPDGDPLAYWWDFGDRTVGSNVAVAVKSWASTGEYVARCVVSDMKGGTASDSVVIRVGSPATFQIAGQIIADGQPLADARVFITSSTTLLTYSDSDGTYTLTSVGAGTFNVTAAKWGHNFATNPVTVGPNASGINFTSAPLPVVTIDAPDAVAAEGGDTATLVVNRTGSTANPLDVRYFRGGTATYSSDYTILPAPSGGSPYFVTIPAGANSVNVTLTPVASGTVEPLETAIFNLAAETNAYLVGSPGTAVVNIFDSTALTAVIQTIETNATELGDADGVFRVVLSSPASSDIVATYKLTGTASNGLDFVELPGTVTIESNTTTALIRIIPLADALAEGTESVTLTLTAVPGYTFGSPSNGTVAISDNNPTVVELSVPDPNAAEAGPDTGRFLITRTGATTTALRVYYSIGGTAIHGTDYLRLPGSVLLSAGESTAAVIVTPVDDDIGEWNQTVILQLSSRPEYRLTTNRTGTVTIVDNDKPLVSVTATDGYAAEPSDTGNFRVIRTGSQGGTITVNYTLTGTASNGVDFNLITNTITLGASATAIVTTNLLITPIDDAVAEDDETVIFNILPSAAYTLDPSSNATVMIRDNEQPAVSITTPNWLIYEFAPTSSNLLFFSRSSSTGPLTVNYAMTGEASNGVDYTFLPGTVTFASGISSALVYYTTIQDSLVEGTEKLTLTILPGAGYGRNIASSYTIGLVDDDANPLTVGFNTSSSSASESNTSRQLLVTLSAASANTVTVNYAFSAGSATGSGIDFLLPPGTLTFPPGGRSNTINVAVIDDTRPEANETFTILLSNPLNAALGTSSHTVTIIDDDFPTLPTASFLATVSTNSEAAGAVPVLVGLDNIFSNTVTIYIAGQAVAFAPGETTRSFITNLVNNAIPELTSTLTLTITGAVNAVIGTPATHVMTVLDDDAVMLTWSGSIDTNWDTATANWSGSTFTPSNIVRFVDAGITRSNVFIQAGGVEPLAMLITNATKTFTFFGDDIRGNTALTKEGSGTATFSNYAASLSFTGGVLIRGGTVEYFTRTNNLTVAFGAGTNTLSGATFRFRASSVASGEVTTLTNPFNITTAGGTLSFSRFVNNPKIVFSGPVSLDRATFWIAGADANGGGGVDHHTITGPITLNGTNLLRRITNHAGANFALTGDIGDGALPGTLVLSNSVDKVWRILGTNNTYSGGTIIGNNGVADNFTTFNRVIEVGINSALGLGNATVLAGGCLALHGSNNLSPNATLNLTGTVWIAADVTNTVSGLALNGVNQLRGVYSNANAPAFLFGAGAIRVMPLTNAAPTVLIASPSDGATFDSPTNLTLTATVSDPDSPTATVDFYADAIPIGTVATPPYSLIWSNAPGGAHALTAIATDELGASTTSAVVNVTVVAQPTITLTATDPFASELNTDSGAFTVTRAGNTNNAVIVQFSVTGSASNGLDFVLLPDSLALTAGQTNATLAIVPLPDTLAEGTETIGLTLAASINYVTGTPSNAIVTIADMPVDAWRVAQFGADANNPAIAGDLADIDGDGLVNLLEYTLHLDPNAPDAGGVPQPGTSGGFLTLTYQRCKPPTDVTYIIEAADTPAGPWTPVTNEEVLTDDGTWQTVKAIDDLPVSGTAKRFIRLRVTRP